MKTLCFDFKTGRIVETAPKNVITFIIYSEVDVGPDAMDCVYFFEDECRAQPFMDKTEGYYKPTQEDQTGFCRNPDPTGSHTCPRAEAYRIHLRMINLNGPRRRGSPN